MTSFSLIIFMPRDATAQTKSTAMTAAMIPPVIPPEEEDESELSAFPAARDICAMIPALLVVDPVVVAILYYKVSCTSDLKNV